MHSDIEIDALKEIGNIGAGHAATALSTMVSRKIRISVPQVRVLPFAEVPNFIGGSENLSVGILMKIYGLIEGTILLLIPEQNAKKLTNLIIQKELPKTGFSDIEKSALMELGNILASSYIAALADFTNLNIKITVPGFAHDMAGAILSVPLSLYGCMGDTAFLLDTEFTESQEGFKFHFLLIPEDKSTHLLLKAIGVSIVE
jgi:chemotaxis protein CheC